MRKNIRERVCGRVPIDYKGTVKESFMKRCMGCMTEIDDNAKICPYCGYRQDNEARESYYLAPGTVIQNRYIVGRVIGAGGFGITYIGWDNVLRRVVAVKEYFPSAVATRGYKNKHITVYSGSAQADFNAGLESFMKEAKRLAGFGNIEGIVQIFDCLQENGTGYIIMEYLKGKTVKEILKEGKRYTADEAVTVLTPVMNALSQMHREGIIHRDIAPDNIFVTDEGEVKLLDFGAARYASAGRSRSLSVILKPGYAPEEQYRMHGEQGPWTDIYSLGATMYRMITGRKMEESVDRIVEDHVPLPSSIGAVISPQQEAALMKSVAVLGRNRFQSVDEMKAALTEKKNARREEPPVILPPPVNEKRSSGGGKKAAGIIAAVLVLAAGIGTGIYLNTRDDTEPKTTNTGDVQGQTDASVTGGEVEEETAPAAAGEETPESAGAETEKAEPEEMENEVTETAAADTPEAETEEDKEAAEPTATETPSPEPTAADTTVPEPAGAEAEEAEPTATDSPTPEPTATDTPTPEPTATDTPTPEPTATDTPTPEPTATDTPTPEPTAEETPESEPTATDTPTPEPTATDTPTPEPTATDTPTPEPTATDTPTPEPTATDTPTPEPTATDTPTPEPTTTDTPTPEPTATDTPAPEPTETDTPAPEPTEAPAPVLAEGDSFSASAPSRKP